MTPLHKAVLDNNVAVVLDLLSRGAYVNATEPTFQETPLVMLASQNDQSLTPEKVLNMTKILTEAGADVNAVNCSGDSALHKAAIFCNIPLIECLINYGADINICNKLNRTPLHKAVDQLHNIAISASPIPEDLKKLQLGVVKILLKYKADVNIKDRNGCTPLFLAIRYNYSDIALLLIDYKSDIGAVSSKDGITPLHFASCNFNKKLIKLLLKKGAFINALDNIGHTPLMYVLENQYQTNNIKDWEDKQLQALKILLKSNADVNIVDSSGENILTINPTLDNNCLKTILEHSAKMDILHPSLLNTISSKRSFSNYFAKCKKEVAEAKTSKIHDYPVTYFDVLNHENKLINYAHNKDLADHFEKSDYKKRFRIYAPYMEKNMTKAVKKHKMHDEAVKSLKKYLPMDANELVIERIIKFFDKLDLQKLQE